LERNKARGESIRKENELAFRGRAVLCPEVSPAPRNSPGGRFARATRHLRGGLWVGSVRRTSRTAW